jgi:hypothetical protein
MNKNSNGEILLKTLRRPSRIAPLFLLAFSFCSKTESFPLNFDDGYMYKNCASSINGPTALVDCKILFISKDLKYIQVSDVFEDGISAKPDKNFFVVRSATIAPIAIPKENYDAKSSWTFFGRKFIKARKDMDTLVQGEKADVIVVIKNIDRIKNIDTNENINSIDLLDNIEMSFWYSQSRGIEAIAFDYHHYTPEVYYCSRKPCLFERGMRGE